jgi:hypothetical protein
MDSDYENDNNWGNKKSEYYEKNKRDKDDDNYIEEEEEAIKIQQAKLKKLKEMNLLDSDNEEGQRQETKTVEKYNLDSSDESEVQEKKVSKSKSKSQSKSKSTKSNQKEIILTEDDEEEQSQILKNIKINLTEIDENIKPILEIFENEIEDLNLDLKSIKDYLKAKKNIHNLYIIYMLYYIYFKNQKKISDHHPVVKKMFFLKSTMNKLKSFNENIFVQVDKVLKLIETKKILDEEEDDNLDGEDIENSPEQDENDEKFLNKKRLNDVGVNELIESTKCKINNLRQEKDANILKAKERLKKEIENKNMMGQRLANDNILKSRGIYRKRKRYQGNAKLHLREKYHKKEKQRKNMIKTYEGKPEVYGGELTGIRRDLIRSTKFK